ncbi:hypothetical protein [Diaphorobacter sp.]|uniref:hypothetical protein n=1 Tax=Diaphorobacter sp. TaxID=1934310 RepID=UPI0028A0A79E|nr:hypothetical protein [Diaphorobacter sp.]
MNYQISEAEHRNLELLRDQLNLVIGLLTGMGGELGVITSDSLFTFLEGRCDELKGVIKAVEERFELQLEMGKSQGDMLYFDWMHALRIASGDARYTPNGSEARISEKLRQASQIDPDMRHVLDAWNKALERHYGPLTPVPAASPKPPAKPRKREKLARGEA